MSTSDVQARLRQVFDKFDVDSSGTVSTEEMGTMIRALKMDMSREQIDQLVKDADPDGSGEIDFEEFTHVLEAQMRDGGQLADVVNQAANFFGWLDPRNWFAEAPAPAPAPVVAKPKAKAAHDRLYPKPKRKAPPKAPSSSSKALSPKTVSPNPSPERLAEASSPGSPGSLTNSQWAQWRIQYDNHTSGTELKAAREEWLDFKSRREASFMRKQRERIAEIHGGRRGATEAVNSIKGAKLQEGLTMRHEVSQSGTGHPTFSARALTPPLITKHLRNFSPGTVQLSPRTS